MLVCCWTIVCNAGPKLYQRCFNVTCLLGTWLSVNRPIHQLGRHPYLQYFKVQTGCKKLHVHDTHSPNRQMILPKLKWRDSQSIIQELINYLFEIRHFEGNLFPENQILICRVQSVIVVESPNRIFDDPNAARLTTLSRSQTQTPKTRWFNAGPTSTPALNQSVFLVGASAADGMSDEAAA